MSFAELLKSVYRRAKGLVAPQTKVPQLKNFGNLYIHERMLADVVRMRTYREAIERHIKPGDIVVDVGTGTGVLAIMADRQRPKVIYAIDHSPFIDVARRIALENGARAIEFIEANSHSFAPPEKVDVILHEQIGDDLFEEDMVGTLLDLKRRVLRDSGRILPGRFELFLEPVCLKEEFRLPYIWESTSGGVSFSFLENDPTLETYKHSGYPYCLLGPWAVDYLLCEPRPLLTVDLNEIHDHSQIPRAAAASRTVTRAGTLDGLLLYFSVIFDDAIRFDTAPMHTRTHWMNRMFRTEARSCALGDTVQYELALSDLFPATRWSLKVAK